MTIRDIRQVASVGVRHITVEMPGDRGLTRQTFDHITAYGDRALQLLDGAEVTALGIIADEEGEPSLYVRARTTK